MREENFWCKKPRYSEVRVIARRVIARYDCTISGVYVFISPDNVYDVSIKRHHGPTKETDTERPVDKVTLVFKI